MNKNANRARRRVGRPSKFAEPSHPVTVTLPDRILDLLQDFDSDRAAAITRIAEQVLSGKRMRPPQVEVVEVAPGIGLIVVESSEILKKLPWLKLVRIAHRRFIITIESGVSIDTLEVGISDLIADLPAENHGDGNLLTQLRDQIRSLRRARNLSKAELLFVAC